MPPTDNRQPDQRDPFDLQMIEQGLRLTCNVVE
jgi:hypothetical protein